MVTDAEPVAQSATRIDRPRIPDSEKTLRISIENIVKAADAFLTTTFALFQLNREAG